MTSLRSAAQSPTALLPVPLARCRAQYSGPVFLIASGPSAARFALHDYSNYPMMTMNGAISKFLDAGTSPSFYVSTDESFSLQHPKLYTAALASAAHVFIRRENYDEGAYQGTGQLYLLDKADTPTLVDRVMRQEQDLLFNFSLFSRRKNRLGFSKNLEKGIFDCRTVAYSAIQLAYHLGFNQVFLVGVDLDQAQPRFYETADQDQTISPCCLDEHFDDRILPSFQLLSERVVDENFTVYNLSEHSRIPDTVIPKVTVEQVDSILGQLAVPSGAAAMRPY